MKTIIFWSFCTFLIGFCILGPSWHDVKVWYTGVDPAVSWVEATHRAWNDGMESAELGIDDKANPFIHDPVSDRGIGLGVIWLGGYRHYLRNNKKVSNPSKGIMEL